MMALRTTRRRAGLRVAALLVVVAFAAGLATVAFVAGLVVGFVTR